MEAGAFGIRCREGVVRGREESGDPFSQQLGWEIWVGVEAPRRGWGVRSCSQARREGSWDDCSTGE